MRIGIDIDGVLTDEHQYIIDYGTRFFYKNNIPFKINKKIYDSKEVFGVSQENYEKFWDNHIFEYSKKIPVRDFASEIINKLKEKNTIYIITSRSYTTYENQYKEEMQNTVKKWLINNKIFYDEIIFTDNKSDICKKLNIDLLIEDKPENIKSVSEVTKVICYDHPYNEDIDANNVIRAYSWYDIYERLIL